MEIVWNKLILWIIAAVLALVIIVILVNFLNPNAEGSLISNIFGSFDGAEQALG